MDLGEKGRGQMDSMMHRILLFILNNQSISAHVLMEEFYLSKNQLDYRIGKVNEFLQEKGFAFDHVIREVHFKRVSPKIQSK